jgi:ubiquinol-cytochrome c reductase cytochrome b subunit
MHYISSIEDAFFSIEHIMRDVNNGWVIRYFHLNGASMFFIGLYLHIGRGLYYGSYILPRSNIWNIGIIIFFLLMAIAFLGYVLPWGQMSFWGATVITNIFSAIPWIGEEFVKLIWGGFSVNQATLNRFFILHFLFPFLLLGLVIVHIIYLHIYGSSNILGINSNIDKVPFNPYFINKDIMGFLYFYIIFSIFVYYIPNYLGHSDNSILANSLVTPEHIVPEWYFLLYYAILRSIPNKLLGVILLLGAILVLIIISIVNNNNIIKSSIFRVFYKTYFWVFIGNALILGWIGGQVVENPYIEIGLGSTFLYFIFFFNSIISLSIENLLILKSIKDVRFNR